MSPRSPPRRVVTLPPGLPPGEQVDFCIRAVGAGADLLELRNDLHPDAGVDVRALASVAPLLVSQRGRPLARAWCEVAALVDVPLGEPAPVPVGKLLRSLHAERPLGPDEALFAWQGVEPGAQRKHVEPLGRPTQGARLLQLQEALGDGATVLATGALALPFRALLSARNALDYLALEPAWAAAPGQRLLADAVRAGVSPPGALRLGILGTHISHSRSPEVHPAPFDRVELPPDADIPALLEALWPWYRGFAVTRPFKQVAAQAVGLPGGAVNTLYGSGDGWSGANTDVDGALVTLDALVSREVHVLGRGGVGPALEEAARRRGVVLHFHRRESLVGARLSGACIWTWPEELLPPEGLRLDGACVATLSYGAPGQAVARQVASLGGTPFPCGVAWFQAQAQSQRALWFR
jgi:hypothetical protein